MIGSVVLTNNPVTEGAVYGRTLLPGVGLEEGSYQHEIRAMGGFWASQFTLLGTLDELRDFFARGLGMQVQSFGAAGELAWEGYIHELELSLPSGVTLFVSLESMGNRAWVRYNTATDIEVGSSVQDYDPEALARMLLFGAGGAVRSTKVNDTVSQARYGVKEKVVSGGRMSSSGVADDVAQLVLDKYSDPNRPSIQLDAGQGGQTPGVARITARCRGYGRTLEWVVYNQTINTGNENVSAQQTLVVAVGEFIAASTVETNTLQVPQAHDADRRALDILFDNARLGDTSNNRWVAAVLEGRRFHYRAAASPATAPRYTVQAMDANRRILAAGQAVTPLELVRPDAWLKVQGLYPFDLTPYASLDSDPSAVYLEAVTYSEPGNLDIAGERNQLLDVVLARAAVQNAGAV